ncbi:MAG: ABC transporter ATP-binding protein [Terriglobales bacterium]
MDLHPGSKSRLYRRLFVQLRPHALLLGLILLLELLSIPLMLLSPVPLKLAVDSLTGSQSVPAFVVRWLPASWGAQNTALAVAAGLLLAVALVQHLNGFFNWLLQTYTGEKIVLEFRSQLFMHVQRLSLAFHDRKGTADPTYRIQNDAPALSFIAIHGVLPAITAALTLAGMLYITARLDWQMALIAIFISPCLFLLTRRFSGRVHHEWTDVRDRDTRAMAVVQETLGALRVVKAFGQEKREQRRFRRQSGLYVRGQMRLALLQSSFYVLVGVTIAAASALGLFVGVRHVRAGVITVGDLLLMMTYLAKICEPLSTISNKFVQVQSSLVSVARAFSLLDELPDVVERPGARPLKRARGAIELKNVSFHYVPGNPVLRKVFARIPAGAHVGILGRSGTGKTTFISLLTRLYDPTSGSILLDGTDLRDYKLADLRNQFSIVLQEPVLFSTTIAENIAYTSPLASRAEVIEAAKAANAHDFIMRLPDGYDTQVGARGMGLSGGERQRIAMARAFLKDAPILILDEPTSSVDIETEAGIVETAEKLMRGRTTFIIAHRLTTLQNCEMQFELAGGKLIPVNWDVSSILAGSATAFHPEPGFASGD